MTDQLIVTGHANVEDDPTWVHPMRERGRESGRAISGDEASLCASMEGALTYGLDENETEHDRERVLQYLIGLAEGYRELMVIQPLQFLTRQQTAHVMGLPRALRVPWLADYRRACKRWANAGGSMSGRRPVLPSIPGWQHG